MNMHVAEAVGRDERQHQRGVRLGLRRHPTPAMKSPVLYGNVVAQWPAVRYGVGAGAMRTVSEVSAECS